MKLSTLSLDHLGLVAAIFDALGISEVIDGLIPKTRDCKLSHSAIIKALIINGLGFVERRLCQRRDKTVQLWRNKSVQFYLRLLPSCISMHLILKSSGE